jgi:hypothetical protein
VRTTANDAASATPSSAESTDNQAPDIMQIAGCKSLACRETSSPVQWDYGVV